MSASPARSLRVLFLQHAVYPYRGPLFRELSRYLELTVLFCVDSKAFRRWDTSRLLEDTHFDARILPKVRVGRVVVNRGLLREFWRGEYDVVVIGPIDLITIVQVLLLLVAARVRRIPVVACDEFFPTHWYMHRRPIVARAAVLVRRLVYRRCSAFIAWNWQARNFVVSCGQDPAVVFYGPHYYPSMPYEARPDPFPGQRFILTIAYFLERKGLDILIRAFRRLPQDAVLAVAGSGEAEVKLRAAAEDDPRIVFLGHLDESEKQPYLQHAYGFVLPTLWDPWGLVVNEAAYHGVPLIVTDAAGCSDALVDASQFVVPAGDEDALATALSTLLTDSHAHDCMGERSRDFVERCSLDAMMAPVLAALRYATGDIVRVGTQVKDP